MLAAGLWATSGEGDGRVRVIISGWVHIHVSKVSSAIGEYKASLLAAIASSAMARALP